VSSSDLAPLIGANFGPGWWCGLAGVLAAGGLAGAEPVGLGAGLEDVSVEGDAVDDRGDEAGVGEDGSPFIRGTHMFPVADLAFELLLCGSGVSC
jgi:hypothetical protein